MAAVISIASKIPQPLYRDFLHPTPTLLRFQAAPRQCFQL